MGLKKKTHSAWPLSLCTFLLFTQPASKSAGWKFNSLKRVLLVSARVCALWPTAVLLLCLIYCVYVCNRPLMCVTRFCWCAGRKQHQLCLSSLHLSFYCDADQVFFYVYRRPGAFIQSITTYTSEADGTNLLFWCPQPSEPLLRNPNITWSVTYKPSISACVLDPPVSRCLSTQMNRKWLLG